MSWRGICITFPAVCLLTGLACASWRGGGTGTDTGAAGMLITVDPMGVERLDLPVEVPLGRDGHLLGDRDGSWMLVEVDAGGAVIDPDVPVQVAGRDMTGGRRGMEAVFVMKGVTRPGATRRYVLSRERTLPPRDGAAAVTLKDGIMHEGQESCRIVTSGAVWYYHKRGAGFASIEDADGMDWLGYTPGGGPAGEYRGIPNMGYPEGYCHPGKEMSTSRIAEDGPVRVAIESRSDDGAWAVRWDIYPGFARLTVERASHPYWFLYEGTPGGALDGDTDVCLRPMGGEVVRTAAAGAWEGDIDPGPCPAEWVCFIDGDRALALVNHADDGHVDSYWPMQGAMTVFGFGRRGLERHMTAVPARFSVGLVESGEPQELRRWVENIAMPVDVTVGVIR